MISEKDRYQTETIGQLNKTKSSLPLVDKKAPVNLLYSNNVLSKRSQVKLMHTQPTSNVLSDNEDTYMDTIDLRT